MYPIIAQKIGSDEISMAYIALYTPRYEIVVFSSDGEMSRPQWVFGTRENAINEFEQFCADHIYNKRIKLAKQFNAAGRVRLAQCDSDEALKWGFKEAVILVR